MKRIVEFVGRNGLPCSVRMTAEQADFFLRLAEYKAQNDPTITFRDVVGEWWEQHSRPQADASPGKN